MRVHEIALRHLAPEGPAKIVTVGDLSAVILLTALPQRVTVELSAGMPAEQRDLLIAEFGEVESLSSLLANVPKGGRAVLVTETAPDALAVGPLLDAVTSADTQLMEVWSLHHGRVRSALVVVRADGVVAPSGYLSREAAAGAPADEQSLRRIVAEWVLVDFVARGQLQALASSAADAAARQGAEIEALRTQLATARAELTASRGRETGLQRKVEHLQGSASMRIGRSVTAIGRPLARWRRGRARSQRDDG